MSNLQGFRRNVYSQNGEDGVIQEVCRRLNIKQGNFVEFGAWDGKYLSNTFRLLQDGWSGVYIEGDNAKYVDLLKTKDEFPERLQTICAYVQYEGEDTLDQLLANTNLPTDFELLSIDIDSHDWHVWYSLQTYQPKIVIVEVNSGLLPGDMQIHRHGKIQGTSFSAMVALGHKKGYTLVCHTGNTIFVRNDLVNAVGLLPRERDFPELLFDEAGYLNAQAAPDPLWRRIGRRVKRLVKFTSNRTDRV